ncbi:unnamed protein product, partial [Ascophyllum nodosum]
MSATSFSARRLACQSVPSIQPKGTRVHPEEKRKCPFSNRCRVQQHLPDKNNNKKDDQYSETRRHILTYLDWYA